MQILQGDFLALIDCCGPPFELPTVERIPVALEIRRLMTVAGNGFDNLLAVRSSVGGVVAPIETHFNSPIRSGFHIPIE